MALMKMNIIDMLKDDPSLVKEIQRQRDAEAGKILHSIDQEKRIYMYGHKYSINGHPLDAVIWWNGCITMIKSYNDVVSFNFGGCVMANFFMNGDLYVAHIHNADNQREDERINWIKYVKTNNVVIQSMFCPGNESFDILYNIGSHVNIWGVCTPLGKTYSLILDEDETHLISIREYHTPNDYREILTPSNNRNYNSARFTWNRFWSNKQHYETIYGNYIPEKLINR